MKKSSRVTGLVMALIGATLLLNNLGEPRVEALHVPDVVKLVASGGLLDHRPPSARARPEAY